MRRVSLAIAGFAALAAASPASAAVVLTPTFALLGNTSTSGSAGNSITQTFNDGDGHTVSMKVTAWSLNTSSSCATSLTASCITKSYLGDYSHGLGATSTGDGNQNNAGNWDGSSNLHTIDNVGRQDFIIIQFDRKVKLISATFSPFSVDGSLDTDATIGVGKGSTPNWNSSLTLTTRNQLNSLVTTKYDSNSTSTTANTRFLDPNSLVGKVWMIAASMNNTSQKYYDGKKDGFKLSNVKVETVGAVPEPASWAMMIAGFGFAGIAIRRQKASLRFA